MNRKIIILFLLQDGALLEPILQQELYRQVQLVMQTELQVIDLEIFILPVIHGLILLLSRVIPYIIQRAQFIWGTQSICILRNIIQILVALMNHFLRQGVQDY